MTPWDRINEELLARRRDWKWLASELGLEQQTVNHWKTRGVPAKHHAAIEDKLGKSPRWVIEGAVDVPKRLSEMAQNLATLFDMIPVSDTIGRTRAYNIATEAIRRERPGAADTD